MKLEELQVYALAMDIAEKIWQIVSCWEYFAKETIGKQIIKSADSIAANLSEGFGRCHYRENINFSYYSRGSLFETKTWIQKSRNRNLISESEYVNFMDEIDKIGVKLNNYIKTIGKVSANVTEGK